MTTDPLATPERSPDAVEGAIAIIGMAGRLPGAPDVDRYWELLRNGREGVTFFSEEQLVAAGVPRELARDPAYVPARGTLEGADEFDADFFGFSPREAELMDPQFRIFLQCAYGACENAGYTTLSARTGIFAGMGASAYLLHLARSMDSADSAPVLNALILNDKDYLATLTGYKLDLRGPSMTIQTACSTSLVAVHLAAQSLLAGECEVALAGAVSVSFPQEIGYRHDPNGVLSSDGHCRAFDAGGEGIVEGNGAGVVVLKRLEDALEARDNIVAVIRGSAVNNDGSARIGYTAPGIEGQTNVVAEALAVAGVPASSIGFVEAHGTGTKMGDPIEVAALARAHGPRSTPCVLGSVKSNIGHLGAASGIAGLIKAALSLKHGEIPPTLHFERPNPRLELSATGFLVSNQLTPWPAIPGPRRAAVSSFGIGGTNAHVVLEQAPEPQPAAGAEGPALLAWSARSPGALTAMTERLSDDLSRNPADLGDVAFTLQAGRRRFEHRRALASRSVDSAVAALRGGDFVSDRARDPKPKLVFLLPGLGDQYAGMAREPYRDFPAFRAALDRYAEAFRAELELDVRELLLAKPKQSSAGGGMQRAPHGTRGDGLAETRIAQPALFAMTCALADCLASWGIVPDLMLGHSFGEYAAAYLAGVFTFEAAVKVVATRAKLINEIEPGALLSVMLSVREVECHLSDKIFLSAVNAPEICTLAGGVADIEELAARLSAEGTVCMRLAASHAFHSPMMTRAMPALERAINAAQPAPPRIPYVSNVTGERVRPEEATSAHFWSRHLRETVRFNSGIRAACSAPHQLLLELGPGTALGSFARMSGVDPSRATLISCVPRELEAGTEHPTLLDVVARLWCAGFEVDLARVTPPGRRVPLPSYPFERQRHMLSSPSLHQPRRHASTSTEHACNFRFLEAGQQILPEISGSLLVIHDGSEAAAAVIVELGRLSSLTRVELGTAFEAKPDATFTVDPTRPSDWAALLREPQVQSAKIDQVVFVLGRPREQSGSDVETAAALGTFLALRTAFARTGSVHLTVLGNGLVALNESEAVDPARAALVGAARVVAQETPGVRVNLVDFAAAGDAPGQTPARLIAEAAWQRDEPIVVLRGRQRLAPLLTDVPTFDASDDSAVGTSSGVAVVVGDCASAAAALAEGLRRTGSSPVEVLQGSDDLTHALERVASERGKISCLIWPALQDVELKALDAMGPTTPLHAALSQQLARVEAALGAQAIPECWLLLPLSGLIGGPGHFQRAALASHAAALAHQANRRGLCRFFTAFVALDAALSAARVRQPAPVACGSAALPQLFASSFEYRKPLLGAPSAAASDDSGFVAPSGELEEAIAAIWQELLGLARVGANDNFFEFGGQSLMGLQLLSRITATYGVELTLRDLFDAPTVAEQAFRVESALLSQIEAELPAAPAASASRGDAA